MAEVPYILYREYFLHSTHWHTYHGTDRAALYMLSRLLLVVQTPRAYCVATRSREHPREVQLQRWIDEGFLLLEGLWPECQLRQAMAEARELHPENGVLEGTHGQHVEMPWVEKGEADVALNYMSLQPQVLRIVSQLLHTPITNVRLSQNLVAAKAGRRRSAQAGEFELEGDD